MATEATKIPFVEAAAPATPAAGQVVQYAKTDGLMYSKDDAGVETLMSGGAGGIPATLIDAAGDLIVGSAADTAARLAIGAVGGVVGRVNGAVAWNGGTAFPGTVTTGERFYRSDLAMEFYFDGTRWLSTIPIADQMPTSAAAALPFSATVAGSHRMVAPPLRGGSDIYLATLNTSFFVVGGTALSGSHKWVGVLSKAAPGATTAIATVNVDSGASSTWRADSQAIGALMNNGTVHMEFEVTWTKTGTPGNLYAVHVVQYRVVAA